MPWIWGVVQDHTLESCGVTDLSKSKLGSHVVVVEKQIPAEIMWMPHESGCRVITLPDDDDYFIHYFQEDIPHVVVRASSRFPAGTNFKRLFADLGTDDPVLLALRWWNTMKTKIQSNPGDNLYWQAINEPPPYDLEDIRRLNLFEQERMRIADQEGFKCALFTFSVGTPEYSTWTLLLPALRAAHAGKHIVCLNEYFRFLPWIWYGLNQTDRISRGEVDHFPQGKHEGWLMFRYRKLWRLLEEEKLGDVRVFLTEIGCDYVAQYDEAVNAYLNAPPGFWKDGEKAWRNTGLWQGNLEDTYLAMLQWVDSQLQRDPYVLGACIFAHAVQNVKWFYDQWGRTLMTTALAEKLYTYIGNQR